MPNDVASPLTPAAPPTSYDALACVIPCYNAGARVAQVVANTLRYCPRVIVVNDGSTDGAVESLRTLPITVVDFPVNRGKGHALLAGIREALRHPEVEIICTLDADGQHDPAEIPRLYEIMQREEADFVIGARRFDKQHVPRRSRVGNRVTAQVMQALFGVRMEDTQCGFRMIRRALAEHLVTEVQGGRYETEMQMLLKAFLSGARIVPVPIQTLYEPGNVSSHFRKLRDSLRVLYALLRARL